MSVAMPTSLVITAYADSGAPRSIQFTAPDLATIAQKMDQLEEGFDHNNTGATSTNMDDTGEVLLIFGPLVAFGRHIMDRTHIEYGRVTIAHPHYNKPP